MLFDRQVIEPSRTKFENIINKKIAPRTVTYNCVGWSSDSVQGS